MMKLVYRVVHKPIGKNNVVLRLIVRHLNLFAFTFYYYFLVLDQKQLVL